MHQGLLQGVQDPGTECSLDLIGPALLSASGPLPEPRAPIGRGQAGITLWTSAPSPLCPDKGIGDQPFPSSLCSDAFLGNTQGAAGLWPSVSQMACLRLIGRCLRNSILCIYAAPAVCQGRGQGGRVSSWSLYWLGTRARCPARGEQTVTGPTAPLRTVGNQTRQPHHTQTKTPRMKR